MLGKLKQRGKLKQKRGTPLPFGGGGGSKDRFRVAKKKKKNKDRTLQFVTNSAIAEPPPLPGGFFIFFQKKEKRALLLTHWKAKYRLASIQKPATASSIRVAKKNKDKRSSRVRTAPGSSFPFSLAHRAAFFLKHKKSRIKKSYAKATSWSSAQQGPFSFFLVFSNILLKIRI